MEDYGCACDCLDCKKYYACQSDLKIDEDTRNFWLNERKI